MDSNPIIEPVKGGNELNECDYLSLSKWFDDSGYTLEIISDDNLGSRKVHITSDEMAALKLIVSKIKN